MTAIVNPVKPFNPPYYHREYSNDIKNNIDEDNDNSQTLLQVYKKLKRLTPVVTPFISTFFKPLCYPITLLMDSSRVHTTASQLVNDIKSGNAKSITFATLQTTIAIIALASTIFAHPIGMIVTTSQDMMFELSALIQSLKDKNYEASLISLTKLINNTFYLALICRGGLELSIISFVMQAITLVISSREEFKKGRDLEGYGNLLLAAVRLLQGYSQFKLLQRQWEIEEEVKRVVVGELHEKWQFPSDHLPGGIEVDGVKIISWNVLNNAYMEWVTKKDSQGLNRSMISDLDIQVKPNGLTQRDLVVVDMVASMMNSGHVIALQECGTPFLEALQEKLPSNWQMVKSFEGPRVDQDIILYDKSKLTYQPDQSCVTREAYPSVPGRPLQNVLFSRIDNAQGKNLRVVNAHIPGDPKLPVRDEFARYVHNVHNDNQTTVALGDYNFERHEMIPAFEKAGMSDFSLHSFKGNIDPYGKHSKAIDHFFVAGGNYSRDLKHDEVLQNGNLRETRALLGCN